MQSNPHWASLENLFDDHRKGGYNDNDRRRVDEITRGEGDISKTEQFPDPPGSGDAYQKLDDFLSRGMPGITWDPRGGQGIGATWNNVQADVDYFRNQYQAYQNATDDMSFYVALDQNYKVYVLLRTGGRTRSERDLPPSVLWTYT
jgi:hypothetical protein